MNNTVIEVYMSDKCILEWKFSENDFSYEKIVLTLADYIANNETIETIEISFQTSREKVYFFHDIFTMRANCEKMMTLYHMFAEHGSSFSEFLRNMIDVCDEFLKLIPMGA